MAALSAGLDQLEVIEDAGATPTEDWLVRETFARLCDLGPWVATATAQHRCPDDTPEVADAATLLAEHVWTSPDGPTDLVRWGPETSRDLDGTPMDVTLVGLMTPQDVARLSWQDPSGTVVPVHVDVATGQERTVTDEEAEQLVYIELADTEVPESVELQLAQQAGTSRTAAHATLSWRHLGEATRHVASDATTWDLIGDGCNTPGVLLPWFAAADAVYAVGLEGSVVSWRPVGEPR